MKVRLLSVFGAVLVFSALAATNSAATLWLHNGASLLSATSANVHGTIALHHKGGIAGTITIECPTSLADGTVGPGAKDLGEKILNASGEEVTSSKPLICKVTVGTQVCPVGTKVPVVPLHLPWGTELVLEGGATWDKLTEDPTNKKGEPAYEEECNGIKVTCTSNSQKAKFIENRSNGAVFRQTGESSASCNDGGEGFLTGEGEALGFQVS